MEKQYYRNKVNILADQGVIIDDGSLWEKHSNGKMLLVDEDEYVSVDYDKVVFSPVVG